MSAILFKFETEDVQKYRLTYIHLKNSLLNINIYLDNVLKT